MIYHQNRHKFTHDKKSYVRFDNNQFHRVAPGKKRLLAALIDAIILLSISFIVFLIIRSHFIGDLKSLKKTFHFIFHADYHHQTETEAHVVILKQIDPAYQRTLSAIAGFLMTLSISSIVVNFIFIWLLKGRSIGMMITKIAVLKDSGQKTGFRKSLYRFALTEMLWVVSGLVLSALLLKESNDYDQIAQESKGVFLALVSIFFTGIAWNIIVLSISFMKGRHRHGLIDTISKTTVIDYKYDASYIEEHFLSNSKAIK